MINSIKIIIIITLFSLILINIIIQYIFLRICSNLVVAELFEVIRVSMIIEVIWIVVIVRVVDNCLIILLLLLIYRIQLTLSGSFFPSGFPFPLLLLIGRSYLFPSLLYIFLEVLILLARLLNIRAPFNHRKIVFNALNLHLLLSLFYLLFQSFDLWIYLNWSLLLFFSLN